MDDDVPQFVSPPFGVVFLTVVKVLASVILLGVLLAGGAFVIGSLLGILST